LVFEENFEKNLNFLERFLKEISKWKKLLGLSGTDTSIWNTIEKLII
jgi:hypothetical protein